MLTKPFPTNATMNDPNVPYNRFRSTTGPGIDLQANQAASNYLGGYQANKNLNSFLPQNVMEGLGKSVQGVQTQPVEYYQKQIEDLTQPLTRQYERARTLTRGDQAARGTLNDSQAYDPRVAGSIGQLDESYLEQIGNITRGTQLERMKQENENAVKNADRGVTIADMYGKTGVQSAGLDVNMINSLMGYGADRYKSEADLFGNIYGADTDWNKAVLDQGSKRIQDIIGMLELQGYQGVPQEQLFEKLIGEIGYNTQELDNQKDAKIASQNAQNAYNKNQPWYVPNKGWTKDGFNFTPGKPQ